MFREVGGWTSKEKHLEWGEYVRVLSMCSKIFKPWQVAHLVSHPDTPRLRVRFAVRAHTNTN